VNFDWDSANISHMARHNVRPEENNWRILFIVFTRRNGLIRVVTARDATPKEKRRYQR
jgi:uncharacterized DUF497 family protein